MTKKTPLRYLSLISFGLFIVSAIGFLILISFPVTIGGSTCPSIEPLQGGWKVGWFSRTSLPEFQLKSYPSYDNVVPNEIGCSRGVLYHMVPLDVIFVLIFFFSFGVALHIFEKKHKPIKS